MLSRAGTGRQGLACAAAYNGQQNKEVAADRTLLELYESNQNAAYPPHISCARACRRTQLDLRPLCTFRAVLESARDSAGGNPRAAIWKTPLWLRVPSATTMQFSAAMHCQLSCWQCVWLLAALQFAAQPCMALTPPHSHLFCTHWLAGGYSACWSTTFVSHWCSLLHQARRTCVEASCGDCIGKVNGYAGCGILEVVAPVFWLSDAAQNEAGLPRVSSQRLDAAQLHSAVSSYDQEMPDGQGLNNGRRQSALAWCHRVEL